MRIFASTEKFYELFKENVNELYGKVSPTVKQLLSAFDTVREQVEDVKTDLERYGHDVEFLLSKKGRYACPKIVASEEPGRNEYIRLVLSDYHKLLPQYRRFVKKMDQYSKLLNLRKQEYVFIVERINDLVATAIVEEGYAHTLGHGLGRFMVVADPKSGKTKDGKPRMMIDWHKSNVNKASIIARGGTPYHSEKAPDGEKWLVRREKKHNAFLTWGRNANGPYPYMKAYTFKLETHSAKNAIIHKLYPYLESNPLAYLKYKKNGH